MKRILWLCVAVLALMLASCRRPPTAQDMLTASALTMSQADTLQFTIERQGEPAEIVLGDTSAGVIGATGSYQAPGSIYATVQAQVAGFVSEAEVLWLPEGVYYRHPLLAPNFTLVEFEGFDAPGMFSPESGIPKVLQALQEASLGEVEDVDGIMAQHITATAQGEELSGLTGSTLAAGPATVDVWIDQETTEVVRIAVTESDGNGWVANFYEYDEPVEIPTP